MYDTYTTPILASEIRRGDAFELHRKQRTASDRAWPAGPGTVTVALVGGGFALLPTTRQLVVERVSQGRAA